VTSVVRPTGLSLIPKAAASGSSQIVMGGSMFKWFEDLLKEILWEALQNLYANIAAWAEPQIEAALEDMKNKVGEKLSASPLVTVLDYDIATNRITFLVRGRMKLFKGVDSAFMRIEVVIGTNVSLTGAGPPAEHRRVAHGDG